MQKKTVSLLILIILITCTIIIVSGPKSTAENGKQNLTISASNSLPPALELLRGAAKWAANNRTLALYVNWKDNWLAHHSTDGSSWGPWPSESYMDDERFSVGYALHESGFTVKFAGDIAGNLSAYDLLVVSAYYAVEPIHEPFIREFVQNGGGVVLVAAAPAYFGAFCKDMWPLLDLSLIEDWFGAWLYGNTGGFAKVTVDHPFGTSLLTGTTLCEGMGYSNAVVSDLNDDAQVIAQWGTGQIYAFTHEFGEGKVYYQARIEPISTITIGDIFITPETPEYVDNVLVSTIIKDGFEVEEATLSYKIAEEWHNVTMDRSGDSFSATIPAQPYGRVVEYRVFAGDTAGRWVVSSTFTYTVSDFTPPEILGVVLKPMNPTSNDTVMVSANITEPSEASGISMVVFSFVDAYNQWWNTTMMFDDQNGLWNVIVPQQPHNTTVRFYIAAYDKAGNLIVDNNSGEYHVYTVLPEFTATVFILLTVSCTLFGVVYRKKRKS